MVFFQGKPSWAFDAERISGYEAANANFKDEMLEPWQVSIPMLQQMVHMDLAYFHGKFMPGIWNEKLKSQVISKLKLLAPATMMNPRQLAAQPLDAKFDFIKWDLLELKSVPKNQLFLTE